MMFRNGKKVKISSSVLETIYDNLFRHVDMLSEKIGPRNMEHYSALREAARFISETLEMYDGQLHHQKYECEGEEVENIILEKPGKKTPEEIIIIGGHYDTVLDSPGADDNATAIAAILEISRLLKDYPNERTLRFVAFTLEEPPYFDTNKMGSLVYANQCKKQGEKIVGMIALEMLGYFSEEPMSQQYPVPEMLLTYPERGNFVAVVGNRQSQELAHHFSAFLRETLLVKAETLIADTYLPGTDLSDHASFWKHHYPALMITDTAFYRNPYYHTIEDTIRHINFKIFSRLVYGLSHAIKKIDQQK